MSFPAPSVAIGRTKRYWVTSSDTWSPTGGARANDLFTYGL